MAKAKKKIEDTEGKGSLRDRLIKNSTISETSILKDSIYFQKDMIVTEVPAVNIACSADFDGGFTPGLGIVAGPSKHFKTGLLLILARSFLKKNPDGLILFYDSEFGSPASYFESFDIPSESVVHTPIVNIEKLMFDMAAQLDGLERGDKVMIIIDSIGNLASKKEAEDALAGESKRDMTRAQALKSLFRVVTPYLTLKDIPCIAVNHTYKTLEMYAKDVVSGGQGPYLSADWIWIVGRQQETEKEDNKNVLTGYNFMIKIEKSRFVKEKSIIPLSVSFETGINRYSGLFEMALEAGFLSKVGKGSYSWIHPDGVVDEVEYSEDELKEDTDAWEELLQFDGFKKWVRNKYSLNLDGKKMLNKVSEVEVQDE